MREKKAVSRRYFSSVLTSVVCAPLLLSCAAPPPQTKFVIDGTNLKSLDDLIAAMREAAGNSLPSAAQAKDFYKAIAEAFVENIHAIAEAGVRVPREMIARLKKRNVFVPVMVVVVMWGVTFLVPLTLIGDLVIGSLIVMGLFIWAAIDAVSGDPKKAKT